MANTEHETLQKLKQRLPEVPVVMLSGHGQARNIVDSERLEHDPDRETELTVGYLLRALSLKD